MKYPQFTIDLLGRACLFLDGSMNNYAGFVNSRKIVLLAVAFVFFIGTISFCAAATISPSLRIAAALS